MPHEIAELDRRRLHHMLDAARQAIDFAKGRDRASLDSDPMFRRAVIHCIQEIGEAAVRITEPTRRLIPSLPWNQIVGMRHRMVHVYFDINLDLVWEVIAKDLGPLIKVLELALHD